MWYYGNRKDGIRDTNYERVGYCPFMRPCINSQPPEVEGYMNIYNRSYYIPLFKKRWGKKHVGLKNFHSFLWPTGNISNCVVLNCFKRLDNMHGWATGSFPCLSYFHADRLVSWGLVFSYQSVTFVWLFFTVYIFLFCFDFDSKKIKVWAIAKNFFFDGNFCDKICSWLR